MRVGPNSVGLLMAPGAGGLHLGSPGDIHEYSSSSTFQHSKVLMGYPFPQSSFLPEILPLSVSCISASIIMESIDFTIDETDPEISRTSGNFSVLKAHGLLRRYINSSADPGSISQFAAEIHNMLSANDGGQDDGDDEKDGEKGAEKVSNPWWEHTMFAHTLVNFIGKIPHSHRAQDDIVRLLVRLKSSTKLNIPVHDEQYV